MGAKWHKVAGSEAEIRWSAGDVAEVEADGKKLCLARFKDGTMYGFSHICPHAGAPMSEGYTSGDCSVVCPVHSLKFNVKNGRDVNGEGYKLKTFAVERREDGVYVEVGEEKKGLFKWF